MRLVFHIIAVLLSMMVAVNAQEQEPSFWEKSRELAGTGLKAAQELLQPDEESDDVFPQLWKGMVPKLEQALDLEDLQENLPKSAWFGKDQASNREHINALLDQAMEILSISPAQRYRTQVRKLEQSIRKAQAEIVEYRQRRVSAPQDAVWEKTVAEYDAAIKTRQADVRRYQEQLQDIKQQLAKELQDLGLDISDEQLEFLLSTVIGDDLIELGVAFDNVKTLTLQLEQLMVESQEELVSARRYYGMYMVLLQVLERMHQHLITAVDQRYLLEIDAILEKTQSLAQQTQELSQGNSESQAVLNANLEAQKLTLRMAKTYRAYLLEQSREVAAARTRLLQDIAIARNTYETVKVSGELVVLMRSSQRLLDTLLSRQIPPLRTFENLEMKREFEKLTVQLKAGG